MKLYQLALASSLLFAACNNENSTSTPKEDSLTDNQSSTHDGHAENTGTTNTENSVTTLSDGDREFVMKAGMGNTAEVDAGTLAQEKGNASDVKDFGRQMVADHREAQTKLKAAVGNAMNVPDSLDKPHADMKKKLQSLNGAAFDAEYIKGQVKDHKETVALFEKQASGGTHTGLKSFAQSTLPHLKMHLEKAEALAAKSGQAK